MSFLTETFGPLGPLLAAGFLGILLILIALPVFLRKQKDPLDRLKEQAQTPNARPEAQLRAQTKKDKLEKYSDFLEPKDAEEYSAIQLKLLRAGYRQKNAVRMYHFAQFALGAGGLVLGTAYALLLQMTQDPTTQQIILSILIPGAAGYMAPKYWVTRRVAAREEEIINGFPDSLDMMLVCVEAGQSLDQAILRVAREIRAGYPALADEFDTVSQEMKAGKDRISVLRDMSERCGVSDVASFVTVLIQSASFGTSIAEALRVFSAEMRDKRVMRAEEKANTLPTKMTLATMMLTVPPLLVILVGPSVYGIYLTLTATQTGY
ncbi:type II secretion system F family protein [Psychromarinibacter halotolerans]|uniref:Type II secretion system F family protein n=1 Tax=Psychromarinibacter halotolerans TaxID=1775175 RepID=A0ABV7GZJ8_9RHOB|nr:type II secretion system F family protein [Psychromarinibacter halotolerans]MAQ84820.1 pilus assembly protein TadC [Maritimibacter sp.]MDF0596138.1 type II secretion system F family protein [Psychromarinibacter halotolerans]